MESIMEHVMQFVMKFVMKYATMKKNIKKFMVSQNLRQAHHLEAGLTKIPGDHKPYPWSTV